MSIDPNNHTALHATLAAIETSDAQRRISERSDQLQNANAADNAEIAAKRSELSEQIVRAAIDGLAPTYDLVDAFQSELSDKQIQTILDDVDGYDDVYDENDQWISDTSYDAAKYLIEEVILTDSELLNVVADFPDDWDDLRIAIQERDTSDPIGQMLRNAGSKLMLIPLDIEIPDYTMQEDSDDDAEDLVTEICEAIGIDVEANRAAILSALPEAPYGGMLKVIIYAEPADAVGATRVRMTDPYLLIHNGMNGSGADFKVTGALDLPIERGTVRLDSQVHYGWNDVAAVHGPAYAPASIEWIKPTTDTDSHA